MRGWIVGGVVAFVLAVAPVLPGRADELPPTRAAGARAAITQGDYAKAGRIAAKVLGASHLEAWHFAPFSAFVAELPRAGDDAFRHHLDAWIAAEPDNAVALNLRAQYYLDTAWLRRGHDQGANLLQAATDIDAALRLRDDIPTSFYLLLRIIAAQGDIEKLQVAFQAAISRFPAYYPLYDLRLRMLAPRGGGSIEAMSAFVDRFAGQAAPASPLRLLYVSLYELLLNAAYGNCYTLAAAPDALKQCMAAQMQATAPPQLDDRIGATLKMFRKTDETGVSAALEPYLNDIITTPGADVVAGAFLESAAEAMGSDNRLMRDASVHGNYVLDLAAGNVWLRTGFFANAATKYRHALDDIGTTVFPDTASRNAAMAGVHDRLAVQANATSDFAKLIEYVDGAVAEGGDAPERQRFLACRAYYNLKRYDEGIRACTRPGDNSPELFWRGMNEEAAGDTNAALRDYRIVADINDAAWGDSAVIQASVLLAHRKDLKGMLALLNAYPYLYDDSVRTREDLAVAYNNRCYAYMELGELRRAMDDCKQSLRFATLPDAVAKQQRLVRMLKDAAAGAH